MMDEIRGLFSCLVGKIPYLVCEGLRAPSHMNKLASVFMVQIIFKQFSTFFGIQEY